MHGYKLKVEVCKYVYLITSKKTQPTLHKSIRYV